MERVYCEYYRIISIYDATYDMDDLACSCDIWKECRTCMYSASEIAEMKNEDVYCPFWELPYRWVDPRLLGDMVRS